VGAKLGQKVSILYELIVLDPNGTPQVLLGPVSEWSSLGGMHGQTNLTYWPRLNGQFAFRIVQTDGGNQAVLAEKVVSTDKAAQLGPATPPNTSPDGQFQVTALSIDPPDPAVGQTVTIDLPSTWPRARWSKPQVGVVPLTARGASSRYGEERTQDRRGVLIPQYNAQSRDGSSSAAAIH
jgi:hypothetical protein